MAAPSDPVILSAGLPVSAAAALHEELRARAAAERLVLIDGAEVERISSPCLQILAAAVKEGAGFRLIRPSPALREAASLSGVRALLPVSSDQGE